MVLNLLLILTLERQMILMNLFKKYARKVTVLLMLLLLIFMQTQATAFLGTVSASNIDKKTVYLTFDDGPIPIVTDKILDTLKENDIKATFFVVGKEIHEREHLLKRIHEEGHAIGLHTYSHNFKKIYSNSNIFIDEMLKTQEEIKKVVGHTSNIIRFPGGSEGRLTQNFLDKLHENNLKVYDWNVNTYDGVNATMPVQKLINNGTKYKDSYSRLIILMHCNSNNKNTIKALPEIIRYYKSIGYEFKIITDDTKEYYYRIKK